MIFIKMQYGCTFIYKFRKCPKNPAACTRDIQSFSTMMANSFYLSTDTVNMHRCKNCSVLHVVSQCKGSLPFKSYVQLNKSVPHTIYKYSEF